MNVTMTEKKKQDLLQAVDMLKTLSHPLRLAILCDLLEGGEMTAGQIVATESGQYSQSQISQYLGILRDAGYVATRRDGQTIWYSLNSEDVRTLMHALRGIYCS